MNHIALSNLYNNIVSGLGKETTDSLASFIENKIELEMDKNTQMFATKDDISLVRSEIGTIRTEMRDIKAEIMKWMLVFWVGQAAVVFGYLYLFFKK